MQKKKRGWVFQCRATFEAMFQLREGGSCRSRFVEGAIRNQVVSQGKCQGPLLPCHALLLSSTSGCWSYRPCKSHA